MRLYRGQIGILLLVIIGLVLTLVMSIATKSLSDTVLSRQERENTAAFAVAESGVEKALLALTEGTYTESPQTIVDSSNLYSADYQIQEANSFEMYVKEGEGVEIDVSGISGGSISIDWTKTSSPQENVGCTGSEGSGNSPAAIGVFILNTAQEWRREYYNPDNSGACGLGGNGFSAPGAGSDGYRSGQVVSLNADDEIVRLTTIYNNATMRVTGVGLTKAMFNILSSAEGGDAEKDIQVKRSVDSAGSIFDYALFSGGAIVK